MFLYECSGKSKKLKVYQWVPTITCVPLLYFTFGNYFALYKAGFAFSTLFKSIGWSWLTLLNEGFRTNLKVNAKNLVESIHLCKDGMHIRVQQINGDKIKHPISTLKPVNAD